MQVQEKAFINYDTDELRLVIQVYEFLNKRITPREIIAFINEILTIKLLDEDFKERYISIFVLKKDEILKHPLNSITELDYLEGLKSIYYNDSDFSKQITAIIYHIAVDEAIELIYTQELKDALNRNDVDRFNSICKSDFADSIFSSVIIDINILENPIKTLSEIQKDTNIPELQIEQAWKNFYYKVVNKNPQVEKLVIEDWQLILIANYNDDKYLKILLLQYAELITDSNIMGYTSLIDKLIDGVGGDRVLPLLVTKNIQASNLVELVENKESDYKKYKLISDGRSVDKYISELKIDNILELDNTDVLCKDFVLNDYKKHLKTNLNTAVDNNDIQKANDILLKIKETTKNESAVLKDLLDDGKIYTFYVDNSSSTLLIINDLIAMRIARGEKFNTSYRTYFSDVLNTNDENKAKDIGNKILNYISFGELLISSEHFNDSILFKNIILSMFADSSLDKWADINKLIENYGKIKSSLKLKDKQLLNELNEWTVVNSDLLLEDLSDEFIDDCFKYSDLSISKSFIEKFNQEFQGLDNDGYKIVFNSEKDIHFKYFGYLDSMSLTQSSLDVFKERFLLKIQENKDDERWWKIFNKYEANNSKLSIENSLKDIRDQFLNGHIELNLGTIQKILPFFIKYNSLDSSTDIFRTIIKNNFLDNNEFLDILLQNGDYLKNLYQATAQNQKDGFRNIINEKRDSNHKLEQLAKQIGIRKAKDK
ncbi:hypothetical protein [Chryseobacterium limigenitum]|uniref:KAP family P-loop domain-containing protein n=1 Tax=Chryseobacterium limigenitum TaxID=1612149 RepID=A0A1K2IVH3_9FLAO|nr:hypothetical protein [Chryseobacterium limigenitum]SFZ96436.1 hypothetical protein SAMN05216324_11985 [Chryseobacterium limigenitum]